MNTGTIDAIAKLGATAVLAVLLWRGFDLVALQLVPIAQQTANALDRQADALEVITKTYTGD